MMVAATSGRFTGGGARQNRENAFPLKIDLAKSKSLGMAKYVLMKRRLAMRLRSLVMSLSTLHSTKFSMCPAYFADVFLCFWTFESNVSLMISSMLDNHPMAIRHGVKCSSRAQSRIMGILAFPATVISSSGRTASGCISDIVVSVTHRVSKGRENRKCATSFGWIIIATSDLGNSMTGKYTGSESNVTCYPSGRSPFHIISSTALGRLRSQGRIKTIDTLSIGERFAQTHRNY